jgi:hypothetical protein
MPVVSNYDHSLNIESEWLKLSIENFTERECGGLEESSKKIIIDVTN